ncbi:MAG TPA: hypothetical protein VHS96_00410 [Bacteroidia bacterium]|nr:hypothetical protein [Bacteroidia bacterium]
MEIMEAVKKYEEEIPLFQYLTKKTEELLREILNANDVKFHTIESRTKDLRSFEEKIRRKKDKYQAPFEEMTDLCGIRIITYYQDDVDRVTALIREEFEIDEPNSIDKRKILKTNEFGYQSVHFVVSIPPKRTDLPEWKSVHGKKIEIQIRTILQHTWAAISHTLQYKIEESIPSELKRKLFRLAGIIELADEQFLELRTQHDVIKAGIEKERNIEKLDIELNLLTVKQYIETSPLVNQLFDLALEIGFEDSASKNDLPLLEHYRENHDINQLIRLAYSLGFETTKEINQCLESLKPTTSGYFKALIEEVGTPWYIDKPFMVTLLLTLDQHKKFTKQMQKDLKWDGTISEKILKIAKKTN